MSSETHSDEAVTESNSIKMQHYFCDAIKPFLLVYIVYIQVIVINSKTSILWRLNVQSGTIDGFGDEHLQVSSSKDPRSV